MARRGWIVALEGPEDIVSQQLEMLPDHPSIMKLPNFKQILDRQQLPKKLLTIKGYIWRVHQSLQNRLEDAQKFVAEAPPDTRPIVFMHGGAITAQRACIAHIRKSVPEVQDDLGLGELHFKKLVEKGEYGLFEPSSQDAGSAAMRAAETLDDKTAYLQPHALSEHFGRVSPLPDKNDSKGKGPADTPDVKDVASAPGQLPSTFSAWSTSDSLSEGHDSTHLLTAQEVSFQQGRIVPVSDAPEPSTPKEGETLDISLDSDGNPRPPWRIREAKRNEALQMLEGNVGPSQEFQPVMSLGEDVVFLLVDESSSVSLEWLSSQYKTENTHVGGESEDTSSKTPAEDVERFMQIYDVQSFDDDELQREIRLQLKAFFKKHDPHHDYSELERTYGRSRLSPSSLSALTLIEEKADLILAVGAEQGVDKGTYEAIVSKLVKLGKPDGKTYSRTGRLEIRNLFSQVMVAHTSQPYAQQTDNPLATPSKTTEAILPYIAAHLTSNRTTRFLIIDFAHRHLPTVMALREVIGRKKFKIAGVVIKDGTQTIQGPESPSSHSSSQPDSQLDSQLDSQPDSQPSPLARNPTTILPPFSEAADWTMEVHTSSDATDRLNLSTKVWRALCIASDWYVPGAEDKVDEHGNRISIAVTTEGKSKAPVVKRPISIARRPKGYELGKSNFSRPLVPVSPPDSIPASPDGQPAPAPPGPPPLPPRPPPPPPPPAHAYTTAPASPEPTIGSMASGSSGSSKWKELMSKFHKRSPTPTAGGDSADTSGGSSGRLGKKLSALFRPPQNPARVTGADDDDDYDDDDEDMDDEERRVLGRFGSKRYRDEDDKARRMLGLP
ncbi:hypothetical protein CONLIGDRAFT_422593 [Coniochaeta ligniaria NRRL 30616]|uniref:Uncharacterized protein n=1 Tax=Coniochaeta ligniaria NRRL 30616 TaxID=1408157 RepID=A0A1J7IIL0_9PEZI|nr:hypothetical protein CONLIGDRAFT_422593 [Coniochaeta ligniaria NRRL 30616]